MCVAGMYADSDGYIEATAPFKLAKDAAQAERLNTVLSLLIRGMHVALVGLLPVLPEKAIEGLSQLNVNTAGKSLDELFAAAPVVGAQIGAGSPLFPKVE